MTLQVLRSQIDEVDEQIVILLARRFDICREVARLKARAGLPIMMEDRVQAVKKRCASIGLERGLDPVFVERLYQMVIAEVCVMERHLIDRSENSVGPVAEGS